VGKCGRRIGKTGVKMTKKPNKSLEVRDVGAVAGRN